MKNKEIEIYCKELQFKYGARSKVGIYIDGNKVCSIKSGEKKSIYVPPKIYSLYVKNTFYISNTVIFDGNNSDKVKIEIDCLYDHNIIEALFYLFLTFITPITLYEVRRILNENESFELLESDKG